MFEEDTTNHTYSTATWREWRGVTNRLSFVVGLDTDIMPLVWGAQRSSVDNERVQVGLRLDGTTGADGFTGLPLATTETMAMFASNRMKITPGKHFIAATQWASAAGGMAGNWPNYKLFAVVSM